MNSRVRAMVMLPRCAAGNFASAATVTTFIVPPLPPTIEPSASALQDNMPSINQARLPASAAGAMTAVPACILHAEPSDTGLPSPLRLMRLDSSALLASPGNGILRKIVTCAVGASLTSTSPTPSSDRADSKRSAGAFRHRRARGCSLRDPT
jgi:hypothetical protein